MTLPELSVGYEAAAVPLRARLRELRNALAVSDDPEEIWHLKRRIAELTPMLTQMNELAELTAHYYDKGYYRSEKYTLCRVFRPTASQGSPAEAGPAGHSGGADSPAAGNADRLLFPGTDHHPNRPRAGCQQKHRLPDPASGRKEAAKFSEILEFLP